MLNFTVKKSGTLVSFDKLRMNEFDAREDASVDQKFINDLVGQGKVRPPLVTEDYVVIDGRHGGYASKKILGVGDTDAKKIPVNMVGFRYDNLSESGKLEVQRHALNLNMGANGLQRLATREDIFHVVKTQVEGGAAKTEIFRGLSRVSTPQLETIYHQAQQSVLQFRTSKTVAYALKNVISLTEAAQHFGWGSDTKLAETLAHYGESVRSKSGVSPTITPSTYVRRRQSALMRALTSLKYLGDANLKRYRNDPLVFDEECLIGIAKIHVETAKSILKTAEDQLERIQQEVKVRKPSSVRK